MFFVGVDLAWSENNPTGIALIEGNEKEGSLLSTQLVNSDEEIVDYVREKIGEEEAIVSIDAPLAVPNETGQRPAEDLVGKLFRKYDAGAHPANRKRFIQWTGRIRGEDLVEKLEKIGFKHKPDIERFEPGRRIIEVYPHPSMVVLFDLDKILQYKNKPGRDYESLWEEFNRYQSKLKELEGANPSLHLPPEVSDKELEGIKGSELKKYEDKLDAVFCAYIAYYYWANPEDCAVLGSLEEGYILTPVKEDMKENLREINSQESLDNF